MSDSRREFWLIGISFFLVYVVWGSTYLANAWGIAEVPPFIFAAARFVAAGLLLYPLSIFQKRGKLTAPQVWNSVIAGFLLFAVGNGLVVWALQFIDTGLTSLLVSFQPLIVLFLMWLMRNQKPNAYSWFGVLVGILGMLLLAGQPEFSNSMEWKIGVGAVFIALLSWGYSLIWMQNADLPKSIFRSSALQMFFGGLMMFGFSYFIGEHHRFDIKSVSDKAVWSLVYLVLVGSVIAFTAFNYLIKKVSPDKVSTSAFVNPVIALFLGVWLNSEVVSNKSAIAAALLLTGVLFINGQAKSLVKWMRVRQG